MVKCSDDRHALSDTGEGINHTSLKTYERLPFQIHPKQRESRNSCDHRKEGVLELVSTEGLPYDEGTSRGEPVEEDENLGSLRKEVVGEGYKTNHETEKRDRCHSRGTPDTGAVRTGRGKGSTRTKNPG